MQNDVIVLLKETEVVNEYGDATTTQTRKEVFAEVKSVSFKETYSAIAVGLKPELVFVLADYFDYNDEQKVEYNSKTYSVIRTYRTKQKELEIVVTSEPS